MNELCRSMGEPDFYPFVLSRDAVKKLHFIHVVALQAIAAPLLNSPLSDEIAACLVAERTDFATPKKSILEALGQYPS